MLRLVACASLAFVLIGAARAAETKATAPQNMTSPADKREMKACQAKAAAQHVPMDQRAKFLMNCMTAK